MRRKQRYSRFQLFARDVMSHTPFLGLVLLLIVLWLGFSAALLLAERGLPGTSIQDYGDALYWCVAAFSTAGIADRPVSGAGELVGGTWIVVGSMLFFGTIVATVTGYFMRPLQRPARKIIETIEYNLEQMDDLTVEELELLKKTTDTLIVHMEKVKAAAERKQQAQQKKAD